MFRYILFGFDSPKGGMKDVKGYFNTVGELNGLFKAIENSNFDNNIYQRECDYYQVLDTMTLRFVECDGNDEVLALFR